MPGIYFLFHLRLGGMKRADEIWKSARIGLANLSEIIDLNSGARTTLNAIPAVSDVIRVTRNAPMNS